jgi:hypothetical protein
MRGDGKLSETGALELTPESNDANSCGMFRPNAISDHSSGTGIVTSLINNNEA